MSIQIGCLYSPELWASGKGSVVILVAFKRQPCMHACMSEVMLFDMSMESGLGFSLNGANDIGR